MLQFIFNRPFFRDRTMLLLMVPILLLFAVSILLVLLNLESRPFPLATRYSGYDGTVQLAQRQQWQTLYVLPIFGFIALIANTSLAIKVHQTRRDIAIGILAGTLFIGIFSIFVGYSILSLNKLI